MQKETDWEIISKNMICRELRGSVPGTATSSSSPKTCGTWRATPNETKGKLEDVGRDGRRARMAKAGGIWHIPEGKGQLMLGRAEGDALGTPPSPNRRRMARMAPRKKTRNAHEHTTATERKQQEWETRAACTATNDTPTQHRRTPSSSSDPAMGSEGGDGG